MPRTLSEKHKKAISEATKGKPKSDETRQRMAESAKWSEERHARYSAKIASGWQHPNKGKLRDPEVVEQHRQWMLENAPNRGKAPSEETKKKLSDRNRGKSTRLYRLGITDEQYSAEIAAGNRWCFFRKHFAPAGTFNNSTRCCDSCKSDHYRKGDLARKYNLTHEQYEAMLDSQSGGCAICGSADPGPRNKNMHIDHDHATGKVRGILCGACNTAVERMETINNWGLLAAQYLSR